MISPFALVVTLLACLGCSLPGDLIARRCWRGLSRLAVGCGVGMGAVSLLILFLGLLQLFRPVVLGALTALLAVLGLVQTVRLRSFGWQRPALRGADWLAAFGLVWFLGLTLVAACGPVTDWDGLSYHMAAPALYLRHGGIYWIPFIHHSNFPFATEMLFTPAIAFGQYPAAKVVHWVFYVLSVLSVGLLAERGSGKRTGLWASLAFALMPVAFWEASAAYIDLSTVAYTLLSCLALTEYFEHQDSSRAALFAAGLLAGFAAGTKLFSLGWVFLCCVWIVWENRGKSNSVKAAALFLCCAMVACGAWYVKSWVMTGNPIYPFLFHILGGRGWDEAGVAMYRNTWPKFGLGHGALAYLLIPWNFLAHGERFIDGYTLIGSPGPLLAALLPAAVLRLKGRGRTVALMAVAMLTAWFFMSQQTRYLLPVLALGTVVSAAALAREDIVRRAAQGAVLISAVGGALLVYWLAAQPLSLMCGDVSAEQYLASQVDTFPLVQELNQRLPADARVLLYGETRGLYLKRDYLWADVGLSTVVPYSRFRDAREMLAWLKARGWRYALFNKQFTASPRDSRPMALWNQAEHQGLVTLYAARQDREGIYCLWIP